MSTKLYGMSVDHPILGWTRVGPLYPTKRAAREWRSFVRAYWRGYPVTIEHVASALTPAQREQEKK